MKKFFLTCFLSLFPFILNAEPKINFQNEGVFLSDFSVKELEEFFKDILYDEAISSEVNIYPRVYVQQFPADFAANRELSDRNRLFIKILTPLALKINEEILAEREDLEDLREGRENLKDFDEIECGMLELMAQKYDVTTPFKDTRRCMRLLTELLERVDAVPPSLLVAAAAIDTDWGTSRAAIEGNNLYMVRNWYSDEGLVSKDEPQEPYRFKVYPSLEESIREYALKLNSDINYMQFRKARKNAHRRSKYIYGLNLDWAFVLDNNLKNFAGLMNYVMTFYQMQYLDEAELDPKYDFEN